eukprot:6214829-Pleurochrysis_carterae.AAC.2
MLNKKASLARNSKRKNRHAFGRARVAQLLRSSDFRIHARKGAAEQKREAEKGREEAECNAAERYEKERAKNADQIEAQVVHDVHELTNHVAQRGNQRRRSQAEVSSPSVARRARGARRLPRAEPGSSFYELKLAREALNCSCSRHGLA